MVSANQSSGSIAPEDIKTMSSRHNAKTPMEQEGPDPRLDHMRFAGQRQGQVEQAMQPGGGFGKAVHHVPKMAPLIKLYVDGCQAP